ncbi:MAG: putative bifunctional diguanylate cyclase/phosphodiesterase [Aridibacter sp.]
MFVFTVGISSRITIQIPKFRSFIALSDTFIFFALIYYGGEVAVILAAVEAFFSSWRFCNKKITVYANAAMVAICTAIVAVILNLSGLSNEIKFHGVYQNWDKFIIALSVMALTYFVTNTTLAAIYGAFRTNESLWETWKTKYIWTFVTYFVGAASAGVLFHLTHYVGFGVLLATFPIIFLVYQTYKMYLQNVEMSINQADQAKESAAILQEQSIALRESEERFRSAFDYAPIGIALVSSNGIWLKVNRAMCQILGYDKDEFLERDFQSMLLAEDLGITLVKIHELLTGKIQTCQLEQRYVHKGGNIVWASWSVSPVTTADSKQPNLIFQIQDITDKKLAEDKLQYEASHDSLTSLPNRAMFMSRLELALQKNLENPTYKVSILFIDLDRFKLVNDSLGHIIGDQLLIQIAVRLQDCLRSKDIVARLGGDEFTILVEGKFQNSKIIKIAERIQKNFSYPFNLDKHVVYSSASIGVLHNTDKYLNAEDMMRDADTAMYQAKRAGKARHKVFSPDMHEDAKLSLQMETDLRRAVENGDLNVFYQPIYSLSEEKVVGFEALARWDHPVSGEISPDKFIPIAEEIGLIHLLGNHILRRACGQIQSLREIDEANKSMILSVNLSSKQFTHKALVSDIKQILNETGFPPNRLKLEITETVFFEHKERAVEMLHQFREIGIEIDIDDFGTGYSNLGYLTHLPISNLKIDRSFIASIGKEGNNLEIVQTIISLARGLGMKVIAEGVENLNQFEQLKELNCEEAQGYFFSEPICFDEVQEFITKSIHNQSPAFDEFPIISALQ